MHNTLKKTINAEEQLIEHNGENIMKNTKEQLKKNNREQVMEHKPLFFTRPKNAGALLLFALLALSLPEHTAGAVEGDFTYSLINGGEAAQIDDWTGTGSDVDLVIPGTLGGKPVTTIGSTAFSQKTTLKAVAFPDSVTSIGFQAFLHCTSLAQVTLPIALNHLGEGAFAGCTSLKLFGFRRQSSFFSTNTDSPTSILAIYNRDQTELLQYPCGTSGPFVLPDTVEKIANFALAFASRLTEVTIHRGVNSIGANAFRGCTKLKKALFEGDAPSTVGSSAFDETAAEFTVQFYEDAMRFSTPTWKGYPSEALSLIFPIWRANFGLEEDALTAANGDPLLIAYALNLDPTNSAAFLPLPFVESGAFRLDFPADRNDVSLMVERTSDPVAGVWQPAAVTTNSGTGSFSLPLSGSPEKLYLRFTAEQTE